MLLGVAALAIASSASAAVMPLDTGVAPWLYNGLPVAIEPTATIPSAWMTPTGSSSWVGTTVTDATKGVPPGTYIFTLDLSSYAGAPGSFSLSYATDNSVAWTISNGSLGGATTCTNAGDCFQTSGGAPRALTGTYGVGAILTATVVNDPSGANPMGLLVSGTASGGVPEPSTYAMVGIGAAAVLLSRLRRA